MSLTSIRHENLCASVVVKASPATFVKPLVVIAPALALLMMNKESVVAVLVATTGGANVNAPPPIIFLYCDPAAVVGVYVPVVIVPSSSIAAVNAAVRLAVALVLRMLAKSSAVAPMNTMADPDKLIAESELLLSVTVRESVVPDAV